MKIGDKVLCTVNTDKTKKGNHYLVTEVLKFKYLEKENTFAENKAIYVDVGNGCQFKLFEHQYKELKE